jgi:hypothetical protein
MPLILEAAVTLKAAPAVLHLQPLPRRVPRMQDRCMSSANQFGPLMSFGLQHRRTCGLPKVNDYSTSQYEISWQYFTISLL